MSASTHIVHPGNTPPVFGFILLGGALCGAQVRDVRLANELADRGFPVHVWWVLDRPSNPGLRPQIEQSWLCSAPRFAGHLQRVVGRRLGGGFDDMVGRAFCSAVPEATRNALFQQPGLIIDWAMHALIREVCRGVEHDPNLIRHFARDLAARGVTHLLPVFAALAPFARAARGAAPHRVRYLVTFQGYEVYANFARAAGLESKLYRRLRQVVEDSDWPAVAVSDAYRQRISREIGLPESRLNVIPPGIPLPENMASSQAQQTLCRHFSGRKPDLPLLTYVGRVDAEKGIDLLLYAAKILEERGFRFQLAVSGPTTFGDIYRKACRQIAEHLRCEVLWNGFAETELHAALLKASQCVVYPSIHREPFGMVPVEAMAHGTPCLVPDVGGVSGVVSCGNDRGGLHFRAWDSGHLAEQLGRILTDQALRDDLASAAPRVAAQYSIEKLGDRVLEHLGIPDVNAKPWNPATSRRVAHAADGVQVTD